MAMDSGLQLGTKISKTRIRMSCRTASLSVAFQGLSRPPAAVFSDPTDRPWVSDDGSPQDTRDGVDLYIA